jgi:hypothetical protein
VSSLHFGHTVKNGYLFRTATNAQAVDWVSWATHQTFYVYKAGFAVNVSYNALSNVGRHIEHEWQASSLVTGHRNHIFQLISTAVHRKAVHCRDVEPWMGPTYSSKIRKKPRLSVGNMSRM